MKFVLVTGGSGFIGSHTSLVLLEKNYNLVIIDSFVNSSSESIKRIAKITKLSELEAANRIILFKGDLRDYNFIHEIFRDFSKNGKIIESVIHFSGLKSVSESVKDPLNYWDNNVVSTINLLRVMKEFECKTIVFSSSATIYGNNRKDLINEKSEVKPINPYGVTKATIEKLLKDVYESDPNSWKIACLRYFNPVGAHESGLIGEDPLDNPNNIFPILNRVASGKISKLSIYGNDWPTKDGTGVRDYIHVMDLSEGHVLTLKYLSNYESKFITLNLGTGNGDSVFELVKTFEKVNNIKIPYSIEERREGDVAKVVADSNLAKELLRWIPKRELSDMCRDGWRWQNANPNGYKFNDNFQKS